MTRQELEYTAASLYDGGWTSLDKDEIAAEYDLSESDANEICVILAELEIDCMRKERGYKMKIELDMEQPKVVSKCVTSTLTALTQAYNAGVYGDVENLPKINLRVRQYVYKLAQRWHIAEEDDAKAEYREAVRYILAYGVVTVDPQYYGCMEPDTWLPWHVKETVKEIFYA